MSTQVADQIPSQGIDFGYCGVFQTAQKTLTLVNPYTNNLKYEIQTDNCPFQINPSSGIIAAKQKQDITISFYSEEAKVAIATAIFKFQNAEEGTKVLKLSAIGKYPFLTINQERFDFETLLVGKVAQKEVMIKNQSLVPASFNVEKVNDDGKDASFSIDHYQGTIPPNASFRITVKYIPSIVGVTSCAQYRIKTIGGNELVFSCLGQAKGFNVGLSNKSVHFGEVQLGSNTNRLLNIINESDVPTSFQFVTDNKNVFSFSKIEGTVNGKSSTRIIITFTPQQTVNYYERVFCVVRNHQVLYVDLIGTCYDILTKPIPLMQRHVDIYRHKVIMGIHNKQRKSDYADVDKLGNSGNGTSFEEEVEINLEIPIDDPNQVVLHKEMFLEANSENRDVKLRDEFLDFAFTECNRISEGKVIAFDNKYPFEVQVNWVLLQIYNQTTGNYVENPFKVTPPQAVVPANSSYQFTVKFAPYEPDSYFFQVAQCFVQLINGTNNKVKKVALSNTIGGTQSIVSKTAGKTLLSSIKKTKFEEALNEELDPPTCLNLRLVGHSFPPGSQPFIPMVKISPSNKVMFPPAGVNESTYQTVQIVNTSDTPVYYKILQDSTKTFKAFPYVGMISGKSFAIICFEFQPKAARFYNFTAQCIFNHSPSNIQSIHLMGQCYSPQLTLGNNGKLFFPPTFTGVSSKQKLSVKNDSRIPLEFEWKVPEKYKTEISFEPTKAYLLPNEETKVVTTFTPLKKKEYILSVPVYATNVYDHVKNLIGFYNPGSGVMQRANKTMLTTTKQIKDIAVIYDLEIIGAGSDGVISISPKDLDFGTITVGFSKTLSVQVINKSNCNLYIELKMAQKIDEDTLKREPELPQMTKILEDCFKFDHPKGLINAKSKKKVNITFKPTLRFDFDIHLVCIAREKLSKEVQAVATKTQKITDQIVEKSFIKIHAMGDFPLLRFTDVRNDSVSTPNLWERYHLTNLNKELQNPLNESEIEFNNSDKTNQSIHDLQKNLKIFAWDFGKVPIKYGPKPRKITLTLKNIGGVRADWCFKMPNDQEIELEPWADPGEPSDEQAFERHILENKIFQIEPRKGALDPGQQMDINVYYYPKEVKLHYLKVFFSILNGKPLIINFQGQTLHRRAQLQLLKDVYHLPPVPIGLEWAVTYPIEIKNLGITKLKYQIDTTSLEQLNQQNYDFGVFEIQNPEGTLMANETQYIYTLFRPLEAKDYSLDLPIKISDIEGPSAESYTLKIRGVGYHFEDKKPQELPFYEDLPKCRANINENGSMAAFSIEEIDFGELEKGELSRRFVILYNLHPTQKLRFEFFKSGLMCGDNIKLEPMQGELKPNSHQNIKMTLISSRFPTHFEGEIQCQIEWEAESDINKQELKSVHTNTGSNDASEFLFLRLKKRSKITKMQLGVENREGESLIENVLMEAMHDILEGDEIDKVLDDCSKQPPSLYVNNIDNENPPNFDYLTSGYYPEQTQFNNQHSYKIENELKTVSGMNDQEIFRKRMFLEKNFVDLLEFMLEDTIFNLMEEATYEEFDLTQAPKIYIRKDGDAKVQQ